MFQFFMKTKGLFFYIINSRERGAFVQKSSQLINCFYTTVMLYYKETFLDVNILRNVNKFKIILNDQNWSYNNQFCKTKKTNNVTICCNL